MHNIIYMGTHFIVIKQEKNRWRQGGLAEAVQIRLQIGVQIYALTSPA